LTLADLERTGCRVNALSVTWPRRRALLALGLAVLPLGCRKKPPVLTAVGEFSLTDQAGRNVTPASLRGKVWAAAFMFTRCPTVCPRITRRMRELQVSATKKSVALELVSFSVDPEHDTPAVLTEYAKQYGADLSSWRFLTGDLEAVRRTSEQGFKLALDGKATPGAEHFGLFHGSHLVLVDADGQIRGYYRTSEDEQMAQLLSDAESL
jgi:protein SCO1/2